MLKSITVYLLTISFIHALGYKEVCRNPNGCECVITIFATNDVINFKCPNEHACGFKKGKAACHPLMVEGKKCREQNRCFCKADSLPNAESKLCRKNSYCKAVQGENECLSEKLIHNEVCTREALCPCKLKVGKEPSKVIFCGNGQTCFAQDSNHACYRTVIKKDQTCHGKYKCLCKVGSIEKNWIFCDSNSICKENEGKLTCEAQNSFSPAESKNFEISANDYAKFIFEDVKHANLLQKSDKKQLSNQALFMSKIRPKGNKYEDIWYI